MPSGIAHNLQVVRARIAAAAARAARKASEITLVAVSKSQPVELALEGYAAGLRHFGENRVQEAAEKIPAMLAQAPQAHWHLIGHLQRNKLKSALELFSWIHSIDSLKLAQELSQRGVALEKRITVLLEVNVSAEESKDGFRLGAEHSVFWREAEQITALPGLHVQGLMTIAPYVSHAADARPTFAGLRALRDELSARVPGHWAQLSMGMSGDFEVAIEEGATLVRIGTAIFGERVAKG